MLFEKNVSNIIISKIFKSEKNYEFKSENL